MAIAHLTTVNDHGVAYVALVFKCPGCQTPYQLPDGTMHSPSGLHMLPVNSPQMSPSWSFNGNLEAPTLEPSILTQIQPYDEQGQPLGKCHSYLRNGVLEFLSDCTHPLAGLHVPLPELP